MATIGDFGDLSINHLIWPNGQNMQGYVFEITCQELSVRDSMFVQSKYEQALFSYNQATSLALLYRQVENDISGKTCRQQTVKRKDPIPFLESATIHKLLVPELAMLASTLPSTNEEALKGPSLANLQEIQIRLSFRCILLSCWHRMQTSLQVV
jgi:hypothetical protein